MIGFIVLGLALLFFIVVAFFAAKSWHVGHVVAMVFLFLFTLTFLFMTSTLMRIHNKFRPEYQQASKALEEQLDLKRTLTYGSPSEPSGEGSLVGERTLAREEQSATGRIWGNVRGTARPGAPILLDMRNWMNDACAKVGQDEDSSEEIEPIPDETISAPDGGDPGDAGGVAGIPHGIVKDQFLYAFKVIPISRLSPAEKEYYFEGLGEGEDAFPNQDKKGNCRVPIAYLGKFVVQDAQPDRLAVVPVGALTPGQQQQLADNVPWVLYENLPTDSHEIFKDVDPAKLASLVPLQRLTQTGVRIPQQAYQAMLNEYAQDGKEAQGRPNAFRLQVPVKFNKEYEQVVDLVVEGELPPTDQPFNVEGRAQVKSLLQGEPTKFAQGDVAHFDMATAERLKAQGIAEPDGPPVYSRRLRDFEFELDKYQDRFAAITVQTESVQDQVNDLTESLKRLQEQIDKHRNELVRLQEDQQGFQEEQAKLARYRDMLGKRLRDLQQQVRLLSIARVRSTPIAAR